MKPRHVDIWILAADLCWTALALLGAGLLRYRSLALTSENSLMHVLLPLLCTSWLIWFALSLWTDLDGFRGGWRFAAVVSQAFIAVGIEMAILLSLGYLARDYVSRLALIYFGALLLVGVLVIRCTAWLLLRARHRTGAVWRVAILGTGRLARELASKIERHPEMLCRVVGLILPEGNVAEDILSDAAEPEESVKLSSFGIADLLREQAVDELILALPQPALPEIRNVTSQCRECGISISVVPQSYELYLSRPSLIDIDGLPILQLRATGTSLLYLRSKRVLDRVLASVLAVLAAPLLLPFAAFLRLRKGKAFRSEVRCGQFGNQFTLLRLNIDRRSVYASRLEAVLEKLSITELPQLWNVIRGDMSLVGPRPEPPVRVDRYSAWHQRRLTVKPGMTGLAQVHGLRDQNSSEEKARFDLQYVMHPSLLGDISLLIQTIWTLAVRVLKLSGLLASFHPTLASPPSPELRVEEMLPSAHSTQSSAD